MLWRLLLRITRESIRPLASPLSSSVALGRIEGEQELEGTKRKERKES